MQNNTNSTLVINFFGGPGCGKSIMAADVFSKLKWRGHSAELALEYAKTRVYQNDLSTLTNQIYLLGKQHHIVYRLLNKVQFIITDSPFLLGCIYDMTNNDKLESLIVNEFKKFKSYNLFLLRDESTFETAGRVHDLKQSKTIDSRIIELLNKHQIEFESIKSCPENANVIVEKILKKVASV